MTAQELFRENNYQTFDNRSVEWRSINKALNYGIKMILVPAGKYRVNSNGYKWKIYLEYDNEEGQHLHVHYYAPNLINFVCGKWQSSSSDIVSGQVLECILDFRQRLIDKGMFKIGVEFEKNHTMCKCTKCKGKGIIPEFMHISKGICFDCMGLGYGKQGKL